MLVNFHQSTPKTDYRNGYTKLKLKENSLFHDYKNIHVATKNSQVSFQSVENEGITMTNTVFFNLMNFH